MYWTLLGPFAAQSGLIEVLLHIKRNLINYYDRETFKDFKKTDKFSSHSTFTQPKTVVSNHVPTIEELRARLNLDSYKFEEDPNILYNDNIQNQEEIKKRKQELINGTKNLLKGIYNNTSASHYQETYK
jgi:hypothetical protein